ncbi:MAG: D-alanyl-D-alanine carboxypeptidase family protein [Eubacteriales bacterium]|nr:D-alanyl-D-alanine carboxypeptidase family protein [Eubacteriales bacterium]
MAFHACAEGETEDPQNLYARSAVLMDGDSGRVLFAKEEDTELPMASTTKIMTCILALELGKQKDVVTVSERACMQPEVHLGAAAGTRFYLEDLLYSLMLESHNDSAVMIAEHIGGSVEGFADLMNQKAEEIGCVRTHFVTPNGLDASDEEGSHHTTAKELARIMSYCINQSPKKEAFLQITRTGEYTFTDLDAKQSYFCRNHNAFLGMMEGALSGKTGFTSEAGYCYVGALKSEGRLFVVSLLACGWPYNRSYKWSDTRRLMEYGMEHYHKVGLVEEVTLPAMQVVNGIAKDGNPWSKVEVGLRVQENDTMPTEYLLSDREKLERRISVQKMKYAPVAAGEVVGKVQYFLGDTMIKEEMIITVEKVPERRMEDCLKWVLKRYSVF